MAPTCCGKEMVVEDGMRVCEVCGNASEELHYEHGRNDTGVRCSAEGSYESNLRGTKRSGLFHNRANYSTSRWKKIISNAADILRLNHERLKEANALFEKAYYHSSRTFTCKQEGSKRGLCGACLHVVCQADAIPIPYSDLCKAVQAEKSDVYQALKDLKIHLGIHVTHHDRFTDDHVQICLKKYGLESLEHDLKDDIRQIFKSLDGALLETGFTADPHIIAAALLAWQRKFDLKITLRKFQQKTEIRFPATLKPRLAALRSALYKMAIEVPWVQKEMVTNINAITYLDDILKYQQSHCISVNSSDSDSDDETKQPTLKKIKLQIENVMQEEELKQGGKVSSRDLDCEELNENDIPESELDEYIYLDGQKPNLKTLKKLGTSTT